jgi:hypothetical protein
MRSPPGSAHRTRPGRSPMARWYGGIRATRATCFASSTSCGLTRLAFSASGHARAVRWRSQGEPTPLRLGRRSWTPRCTTARRVAPEQTPTVASKRSISFAPKLMKRPRRLPLRHAHCMLMVALVGRVPRLCSRECSSLVSVGSPSASSWLRCQSPAALLPSIARDRHVVVARVPPA